MKKIISLFFSFLIVISSLTITANAATEPAKDIHQETVKINYSEYDNFSPDNEIEVDGKKYVLKETKIISNDKKTFEIVTDNLESEEYSAPQEISNPNNTNQHGKLINTTFSENRIDGRQETVAKNATYTSVPVNYEIPKSIKLIYHDDKTNSAIDVNIKLTDNKQSNPYWKDINNLSGGITGYDALYYNLENSNIQIPKNESQPTYKGYENEILKSLGLSITDYKIVGSSWQNEAFYNSENILCRNCVYNAQAKVCDITATYSETINLPDIVTYTATSVYEDLENSQYTIELDYEEIDNDVNIPVIVGSAVLGVLILAALIAAILMHLSKKKKSEVQTNAK